MSAPIKLTDRRFSDRDLLFSIFTLLGGDMSTLVKLPTSLKTHGVRDLLYSILQNGITAGGGDVPDGSITEAKLAPNAVTSSKVADGSITAAKLGAGSVSDIVSTTKKVGLGVSADGVQTFDAKGRISAVQEASV
jgi:hypothetical protein